VHCSLTFADDRRLLPLDSSLPSGLEPAERTRGGLKVTCWHHLSVASSARARCHSDIAVGVRAAVVVRFVPALTCVFAPGPFWTLSTGVGLGRPTDGPGTSGGGCVPG